MYSLAYLKRRMRMCIDSESLSIFIDTGHRSDIVPIVYYHETEWIEDAETVVPAMLQAINLYNTDKKQLLDTLGFSYS